MYSLPMEFLEPEALEGIKNTLGSFINISKVIKTMRFISDARVCVYMHVAGALLDSIIVSYQNEEWTQSLDFEDIPFRCKKCHVHGHIFRYDPLNSINPTNKSKEEMNWEGL